MRVLFVHQNFPGQYLHIIRNLVAEGGHELWFISNPNQNRIAGVNMVHYTFDSEPNLQAHVEAREFETAMKRAQAVAKAALEIKKRNFVPDVILGHQGWGELLSIQDVWPGVPVLGYLEFYYQPTGFDIGFDTEFQTSVTSSRIRARNAINHLAMAPEAGAWGQTPTEFQLSTYPSVFHDRIRLVREGVDLDQAKPDALLRLKPFVLAWNNANGKQSLVLQPEHKVVTYLARGLEPYRGFHVMMRMLPGLLTRKDVHVVIVGEDRSCYGPKLANSTWKEHMLVEMASRFDHERVHFVGHLQNGEHLRLFQRSDAHLYLTYPFVASWSLREALACGCAVVGSDTAPVREFIKNGINGVLGSFFNPKQLVASILELFEDKWLDDHVRSGARAYAQRHLDIKDYLSNYRRCIDMVTAGPIHGNKRV